MSSRSRVVQTNLRPIETRNRPLHKTSRLIRAYGARREDRIDEPTGRVEFTSESAYRVTLTVLLVDSFSSGPIPSVIGLGPGTVTLITPHLSTLFPGPFHRSPLFRLGSPDNPKHRPTDPTTRSSLALRTSTVDLLSTTRPGRV